MALRLPALAVGLSRISSSWTGFLPGALGGRRRKGPWRTIPPWRAPNAWAQHRLYVL